MGFALFEREIKDAEIREAARRAGINHLPVLENCAQKDDEAQREALDEKMLANVLKMLERSTFRMHITYEVKDIMIPLVSMMIFRDHILTAIYKRTGIRFEELTAPANVKRLILQAFEPIALQPSGNDLTVLRDQPMKMQEFMQRLAEKKLQEAAASEAEQSHLSILQECFADVPRICCVFDDEKHPPMIWYGVKIEDKAYNIFSNTEEEVFVSIGSCLPILDAVSKRFMARYREILIGLNREK